MRYTERPPGERLARHARCVWCFDSDEAAGHDRIVPDGRPELIVHYRKPYAEIDESGRARTQPRALLAGQLTRPLRIRADGPGGVIGVRFHPFGAQALVPVALRELTDARVSLDRFWPKAGSALAEQVARAPDTASRMRLVEAFVAERLVLREDEVVRGCAQRIERALGEVEVDALARDAGIGRRQLERRFADAVGIGPALLASIFRFRRVFDVIERGGPRPWTEAALAAGYYDQSHFIREFRRFVGCTPTQFEAGRAGLASALVDA